MCGYSFRWSTAFSVEEFGMESFFVISCLLESSSVQVSCDTRILCGVHYFSKAIWEPLLLYCFLASRSAFLKARLRISMCMPRLTLTTTWLRSPRNLDKNHCMSPWLQ